MNNTLNINNILFVRAINTVEAHKSNFSILFCVFSRTYITSLDFRY